MQVNVEWFGAPWLPQGCDQDLQQQERDGWQITIHSKARGAAQQQPEGSYTVQGGEVTRGRENTKENRALSLIFSQKGSISFTRLAKCSKYGVFWESSKNVAIWWMKKVDSTFMWEMRALYFCKPKQGWPQIFSCDQAALETQFSLPPSLTELK